MVRSFPIPEVVSTYTKITLLALYSTFSHHEDNCCFPRSHQLNIPLQKQLSLSSFGISRRIWLFKYVLFLVLLLRYHSVGHFQVDGFA